MHSRVDSTQSTSKIAQVLREELIRDQNLRDDRGVGASWDRCRRQGHVKRGKTRGDRYRTEIIAQTRCLLLCTENT